MPEQELPDLLPATRRELREQTRRGARARHDGRHGRKSRRPAPRPARRVSGGRSVLGRLPIVALILAGVGLLLYPATATWLSDRAHALTVSSYAETVEQVPDAERARILQEARDYNSRIGVQTLTDPYTDVDEVQATSEQYLRQLRVDGSDVMARIRIPTINVALPIRHGTSEETLATSVGHLQGSSLPVGGRSTKSVLTGHSGLPNASLFTDLHSIEVGDMIYIDVLGETLAYRTSQIEVVLPTETDLLNIDNGQDRVVLITCTPIGVNSHRLMIVADRVDIPSDGPVLEEAQAAVEIPFPWWAVGVGGALVGAGAVLFGPLLFTRRRHAEEDPTVVLPDDARTALTADD